MAKNRRTSLIFEHSLEPPTGRFEHQGSLLEVDLYRSNRLLFTIWGYGTRNEWDDFLVGKRDPSFPRFAGALDREEVKVLHSRLGRFLDDQEEEPKG